MKDINAPSGECWLIKRADQKKAFIAHVEKMEIIPGKPFVVKFSEKQEKRSTRQNRYLFGWVYEMLVRMLEDAGISITLEDGSDYPYDKEILHELFKKKFLVIETKMAKKKSGDLVEIPVYVSSTKLTKQQFFDFIENIKKFSYQFWGVCIPDPTNGYWYDYHRGLEQ